jgi:hypothetical protein
MNIQTYLDPSDERMLIERPIAVRPRSMDGSIVALVDISKARGDRFLDALESLLRSRLSPREVRRFRKPTFARPAPEDLRRAIAAECGMVIEALAD